MIASAILSRPPEVSTKLGKLGETMNTIAPGVLQFVMTGAYHVFPEAAQGQEKAADGEMSVEAATMAYLMRGIHF